MTNHDMRDVLFFLLFKQILESQDSFLSAFSMLITVFRVYTIDFFYEFFIVLERNILELILIVKLLLFNVFELQFRNWVFLHQVSILLVWNLIIQMHSIDA